MSLVLGHACFNCATFIGPGVHPHDKKSFSSMRRIWHLVCEKCSHKFDIPESKLYFVSVSKQWLREHHSLDLEVIVLAAGQGSTS